MAEPPQQTADEGETDHSTYNAADNPPDVGLGLARSSCSAGVRGRGSTLAIPNSQFCVCTSTTCRLTYLEAEKTVKLDTPTPPSDPFAGLTGVCIAHVYCTAGSKAAYHSNTSEAVHWL